ncbi:MAG TPA: TOPRIM nucleotidyl transferase/hydrolase domain-containing protein [Gaiellaceae bacterium]|nr:TOPRIM nucleotidyl transferase/hydrolase domain-containing protein [Gaiellaceae bacterium]
MLDRVRIHGFRAAHDVTFAPGRLCALVGEAASGKSTVLSAVWSLLDASAPVPTLEDVSEGSGARVHLEADLGARTIFLDARPPATLNLNREGAPPTLFLPAGLRSGSIVAPPSTPQAAAAARVLLPDPEAPADGGLALVGGLERLCESGASGLVVLLEEPELFLSPQTQRHLYRLVRRLAENGNQVLYSTHAAVFLSVDRLEELALVRHNRRLGTAVAQPTPLSDRESFRAFAEFDAERAELFLSRAALLVEGRTEKLAFPFVFAALGLDPDREAVAIVDCGGKGNLPLFSRICNECGIPYVVVHDRDAPRGRPPVGSEEVVNRRILETAGRRRTVQLTPDFEAVAGLRRGGREKAEVAWRHFSANGNGAEPPRPLAEAARRVVSAARR